MKEAEIMAHIDSAPLRPNDDTKTMVGMKPRKPMPKWKDQVEQSQKFAAKPMTVNFKHARRAIKPGFDNNFTHLMKSGYQADFVSDISTREAKTAAQEKANLLRTTTNDQNATATWMKHHKNPLLSPAANNVPWTMKKFSNASPKTDTGKVKRRVAKAVPVAVPRKAPTPEPVAVPPPVYVAPVVPVKAPTPEPVKPAYKSTQPW